MYLQVWMNIFIQIAGLALFGTILSGIQEIIASSTRKSQHDAALRSKLTDVQVRPRAQNTLANSAAP